MSNAETSRDPHALIREEDVCKALEADRGCGARLRSFEIKDFTSKGDHYACVVTSVLVKYTYGGQTEDGGHAQNSEMTRDDEELSCDKILGLSCNKPQKSEIPCDKIDKEFCKKSSAIACDKTYNVSYIVKLNPCRSSNFDLLSKKMFDKEGWFYTVLIPMLNKELEYVNEPSLRTPQCYLFVDKSHEQVIYLEDLRKTGYRMNEGPAKTMDEAQTKLVMKELGRLHAASVLLMEKPDLKGKNLVDVYPQLSETLNVILDETNPMNFKANLSNVMENTSNIAEGVQDYKYVSNFLRPKKDKCVELFYEQLSSKIPFQVICHGDCWTNNILFRYSEAGEVLECRLLDLQMARLGSPALDLNFTLLCSLTRPIRTAGLRSFFNTYYTSFCKILASVLPVPFTLCELEEEYRNKNLFGLLMAIMALPMIMAKKEDTADMAELFEGKAESHGQLTKKTLQSSMENRTRYWDLFDDMSEAGLFDEVK